MSKNICDKVFNNGPSKTCGRQLLKNLKGYGLLKHVINDNTNSPSYKHTTSLAPLQILTLIQMINCTNFIFRGIGMSIP